MCFRACNFDILFIKSYYVITPQYFIFVFLFFFFFCFHLETLKLPSDWQCAFRICLLWKVFSSGKQLIGVSIDLYVEILLCANTIPFYNRIEYFN